MSELKLKSNQLQEKDYKQMVTQTTKNFFKNSKQLASKMKNGYQDMAAINLVIASEFQSLENEASSELGAESDKR